VHLPQALAIYQRIGAPAAHRVQQTLQNHKLASTTPQRQPTAPQQPSPTARIRPPPPHEAARQAAVRTHAHRRVCARTA
jgi:hypothetical protein